MITLEKLIEELKFLEEVTKDLPNEVECEFSVGKIFFTSGHWSFELTYPKPTDDKESGEK